MTISPFWIYAIGFFAQILFAARMMVQWIQSEKAGKSLSPIIFWQLSILGSIVFLIYGILRHDFAIVLGQVLVYFIYVRNLYLKNFWKKLPILIRSIILIAPIFTLWYLISDSSGNLISMFNNKDISVPLQIWGSIGQIVFTLRFYIQWIDSESKKESVLSRTFWIISLAGAAMLVIYAALRFDPALFFGQFAGMIVYFRNLVLEKKATK